MHTALIEALELFGMTQLIRLIHWIWSLRPVASCECIMTATFLFTPPYFLEKHLPYSCLYWWKIDDETKKSSNYLFATNPLESHTLHNSFYLLMLLLLCSYFCTYEWVLQTKKRWSMTCSACTTMALFKCNLFIFVILYLYLGKIVVCYQSLTLHCNWLVKRIRHGINNGF